ncbi:Ku protein [Halopseudomonas nanhaiensis]|uniref:non-homologous end joining protein Ku n=1 Tax=Halopseudomonas nanhaiensis TaxID=2830842 RepID=UPI001CC0F943|nr:Ku protein [Halopseudomonas nanhaiensis]UAW97754.1 Ku protein [Halopseudomonas nanhaiensis]
MPRSIWKGAISFGLVHIPVGLVSATSSQGVNFDWLDKRSMDPVGYKRINKATGKEIDRDNIVKGVEYERGQYVVLSDDEIRTAHPKATQTIDIFAFVESREIPLPNIEKPYFLSPDKRGEKVYALLRETLVRTGKVALANVVVRTRQQLAALMPLDDALMLVMLRWPSEVRGIDYLDLTDAVKDVKLSKGELDMATRLVDDMTTSWQPEEYRDSFQERIMELVEEKAEKGEIESVDKDETSPDERRASNVTDLTELLKRSLAGKAPAKGGKSGGSAAGSKPAAKTSAKSTGKSAEKPAASPRKKVSGG